MDLAESRAPLDSGAVVGALDDAGWPWHAPGIVGTAGLDHALGKLSRPSSHAMSSLVQETWQGQVGPFVGADLPAGSALVVSVLVGDDVGAGDPGWLSLLGSLAAADALRATSRVPAEALWPDGISVPGAMCGGEAGSLQVGAVRTDRVGTGTVITVVVAVGISSTQLPRGTSSIYSEGGRIDRAAILTALLLELAHRLDQWRRGDPALRSAYRERCATFGRLTDVPGGRGPASGVDDAGHLLVSVDGSEISIPPPHRLHSIVKH